ncbi:MAG: hypothetical protein K2P25_11400 [Lachnospiraceae bacterium]|nr:hypothetical protein [Lachnospiraceae bacterium]
MTIESERGIGTKVSIVIPAVEFFEKTIGESVKEGKETDDKEEAGY